MVVNLTIAMTIEATRQTINTAIPNFQRPGIGGKTRLGTG